MRFAYDGLQNEVEWRDIETVNFTAGSGGDLVVYQDGTSYLGGGGTDTFYADWSATTQAILWDNAPTAAAITLANGVTVGGFERLLLTTGSGNDIVKNTQVAVSDWIDTRGGNDVIALSGVGYCLPKRLGRWRDWYGPAGPRFCQRQRLLLAEDLRQRERHDAHGADERQQPWGDPDGAEHRRALCLRWATKRCGVARH